MNNILFFLIKLPIIKRLIPSLIKNLSKIFNLKVKVIRNKALFLLNLKNQHDRAILLSPEYEPEQINFFMKQIKSKNDFSIFIDIGACIGFYSLSIAKLCSDISKIIIFEPNLDNFSSLKKNVELNKDIYEKTQLYNTGLSNKNDKIKLFTLKSNDGAGGSIPEYEGQYDNKKGAVSYNVDIKVGDEILKYKDEKIALKIDVERHEINVLKGIKDLLTNNKCLIQIEIFDEYLNDVNKIMEDYKFVQFFKVHHKYEVNLSDYYFKNY